MTTISSSTPSLVVRGIWALGKQISPASIIAGSSILEGAFYSQIRGGGLGSSRAVRWIRETAVGYITEIQLLFFLVDWGAVVLASCQLFSEVVRRLPFELWASELGLSHPMIGLLGLLLLASPAGLAYTAFKVGKTVHWILPTRAISDLEYESDEQRDSEQLLVTKWVITAASAVFFRNPWSIATTLVTTAYSFFENRKLSWMRFSTRVNYPQERINSTSVTYRMLKMPVDKTSEETTCPICLEPGAETAFCLNHLFHTHCISRVCEDKKDLLLRDARYHLGITRHSQNGIYTHTTYHCRVTVPQQNLPSCPACRDYPLQNGLQMNVRPRWELRWEDTWMDRPQAPESLGCIVDITGRPSPSQQPLFEQLFASYNIVLAGVSALKRYPELTSSVFNIQHFLCVGDLLGTIGSIGFLYGRVKEKLGITDAQEEWFFVAALATTVAVGALSYGILLPIHAYLQASALLQGAFFLHWCYLNKLIVTVALSFFAKQKKTTQLSVLAQAYTLASSY